MPGLVVIRERMPCRFVSLSGAGAGCWADV